MKLSTYVDDTSDGDVVVHGWRILRLLAIIGLVIAALTFATWGLGIATAPWVGRQNVHRIINNPNNQIFQYEHFFQLDGDIHADSANLPVLQEQAARHLKQYPPGSPDPTGNIAQVQSELDGAVTSTSTHCQGLVRQYNNDAQEYTKDTFLSNRLPAQEDPTLCAVHYPVLSPTPTGGQP